MRRDRGHRGDHSEPLGVTIRWGVLGGLVRSNLQVGLGLGPGAAVSGVLLDEVAKRARRSKPKAKRVSLTTMPMQSKVMQQHMNEKKDAMQRNESAAATMKLKSKREVGLSL